MACMTKRKYNQGGDLGATLGSQIGGYAVGALGQAFGVPMPVGMAVGNTLGGFAGQAIGNQFGNNAPILPPNQTVLSSNYNYSMGMNPYGNSSAYALGGDLNQDMTYYQGPTHEQGGIPLGMTGNEVEGGEIKVGNYIFSNRLTVPNTKNTFSQMADKIQNKYKNRKGDSISKDSMNRELAQLAQLQEGIREEQVPEQEQQFAYGGTLLNKNITTPVSNDRRDSYANGQLWKVPDSSLPDRIHKYEDGGEIEMTKNDFKKEHTHLLKVLRKGSMEDRLSEANEQAKEMKKYGIKAFGGPIDDQPYPNPIHNWLDKLGNVADKIGDAKRKTILATKNQFRINPNPGVKQSFIGNVLTSRNNKRSMNYYNDPNKDYINNVGNMIDELQGTPYMPENQANVLQELYNDAYKMARKKNKDTSGYNMTMKALKENVGLYQNLLNNQYPDQGKNYKFANGGSTDDPPHRIGDIFKPRQIYSERAALLNSMMNPDDSMVGDRDTWLKKQVLPPSYYSSYSGTPYSAINFRLKVPIATGGRNAVKPEAGVYPSYIYTPENLGYFGNSYIPNLTGAGKNNIGKQIWGQTATQPTYKFKAPALPNNYKKKDNVDLMNTQFKYGGIYIKPENRGKFNATKERTGKTTEELTHSKNPLTRKRAIFAQNAAGWKHGFGGTVKYNFGGPYADNDPTSDYGTFAGVANRNGGLPFGNTTTNNPYGMYVPRYTSSDGTTRDMYGNVITPVVTSQTTQNDTYIPTAADELPLYDNNGIKIGYQYSPLETKNINTTLTNIDPNIPRNPFGNQTTSGSGNDNFGNWLTSLGIDGSKLPSIDLSKLKDKFNSGNLNLDPSELTKMGLSNLGSIYDIARGSQGGQYESYGRLNPLQLRKLDPSQAIQQQREIGASAMSGVKNIGGQGLGQYLNNINAIGANTQANIGNVISQYDNANLGIINQQKQLNNQIAAQNLAMDVQQNDINARERDEASNTIQRGLTGLGEGMNMMFADKAMKDAQDYTIKTLLETKNYAYTKDENGEYQLTVKTQNGDKNVRIDINGNVYDENGTLLGPADQVLGQ